MGAAAWHPASPLLPARLGDIPCVPQQTIPVPWGRQTQDGAFLLRAPVGCCSPLGSGWGGAVLPTLPCPSQDTPTPTGTGSILLGEERCFPP